MKPRLRGCPTCGTPVDFEGSKLGFRDYRWCAHHLPGRVAPTDIDGVLERNGYFLVMEYKPPGVALPMGQRIMLKHLKRLSDDPTKVTVWVVWGGDTSEDAICEVGAMDRNGDVNDVERVTADQLGRRVRAWLDWATSTGASSSGS